MFIYLKTKRYGLDCNTYRAGQIWRTFLIELRYSISVKLFKCKIKTWIAIRAHVTAANPTFTT